MLSVFKHYLKTRRQMRYASSRVNTVDLLTPYERALIFGSPVIKAPKPRIKLVTSSNRGGKR